jgi:vitamin B12 transporter
MKKLNQVQAACLQAAALLACSAALSTAQAQSGSQAASTAEVPEIIVTASRSEQRIQDAMPATTLVTRADIDRAQTSDLPTLLRQVGGVEIAQNGGSGTVSSAFLRGAESRHTLVLIDGVPLNGLSFGTAALEHIALANIERIEIVRGNVSSLYGSAAIGGVIQIFTRESGKGQQTSVAIQKGSRGLTTTSATSAINLKSNTRLSASVESISNTGFNAIDQSKIAGTNPDIDGYTRQTYSLGARQNFDMGNIGLTVRKTKGRTQYDNNYGPATQADESLFGSEAASLHTQLTLNSTLKFNGALSSGAEKLKADVTAYPYYINSKNKNGSAGLDWIVAKNQTISGAVEQTTQNIESNTVYAKTSRTQNSTRLGYQATFDAHQLQANVRQDRYSDFGKAGTHYLGYAYRLTDAWRVNTSISTGFNAPTFNDLYYPYGSGNINLRPERVKSRELGIQYAVAKSEARAVWFSNSYDDLIANDSAFMRVNILKARTTGVEFSGKHTINATNFSSGLTIQTPTDLTNNTRLARRADSLGFINVQHDIGDWQMGGNLKYSGARPDGTKTLESYTLFDLTGAYRVDAAFKVTARIENVTNQKYETVYGYNQPGRGIFVGLNWQPK